MSTQTTHFRLHQRTLPSHYASRHREHRRCQCSQDVSLLLLSLPIAIHLTLPLELPLQEQSGYHPVLLNHHPLVLDHSVDQLCLMDQSGHLLLPLAECHRLWECSRSHPGHMQYP